MAWVLGGSAARWREGGGSPPGGRYLTELSNLESLATTALQAPESSQKNFVAESFRNLGVLSC